MAITKPQETEALKIVAGLFNAAPGGHYLNEIAKLIEGGVSGRQLSDILAATPLFINDILAGRVTYVDQAEAILNNFGFVRDDIPGSAATDAIEFVVSGLTAGQGWGQIVYEGIVYLSGTPLPQFTETATLLDNKAKVAEEFSKTNSSTDLTVLQNALSNVTGDKPYTDADVQAVLAGSGSGSGNILPLTINQDTLTGTPGNDTFVAGAAQDGAGNLINTLQNVDVIDGGAGAVDILNATLSEGVAVAPTIKNIENVIARFADAGASLDLSNATGITTVAVANSTTAGTINNIGSIASLAIKNQNQNVDIGGTAGSATTVALALDTVGTEDANITLDLGDDNASKVTTANIAANNAYVNIDSNNADVFTTANIAATGTNKILFTDSGATLTKVTVTGAGSVDLNDVPLSAVTTFDASASTGNVKAQLTNAAKAVAVLTGGGADVIDADAIATAGSSADLGAGNDTFFVGANLASFDKGANGGDGTDIINITDGSKLTSTTAKYITNFETLDVSGGTGDYDVSLNTFATVQVDEAIAGALAGDIKFTNAPDTFTLTVASKAEDGDFDVVKNTTVVGKDYAGTTAKGTAETFTLVATLNDGNKDDVADGNINAQTVTVADVENLVVQATAATLDGGSKALAASKSTLTVDLVAAAAEKITVTGNASVDLSGVLNIGVVSKVDASASTGDVKLDLSAQGNSVAYTGSEGVDTYTSSAKGDTIYTGKGADVIVLSGAVRDTFVLKASTDSQVTDTSKDAKITLDTDTGYDSITAFLTGGGATADRLDLTNFAFSGAQRGVEDVSALVTGTTDITSVADLFSSVAGDRGVAYSNIGADTYVFVDANKDGNFTAADDIVAKLVAVTSIAETDINF